ncbi:MAG: site-specific integrase [Chitinivibrionales bacterium]
MVVTQRKPRTIGAYMDAVEQFYRFTNGKYPLKVTVNDIRAYLFHLIHERKYAPRTYNQHLYGLKAFYEAFMPDVPIMAGFTRHSTPDFDRPIFRTSDFVQRTGIPKQTAMPMIRQIRDAGFLTPIREASGRRPAILAFGALLNIAEGRDIL